MQYRYNTTAIQEFFSCIAVVLRLCGLLQCNKIFVLFCCSCIIVVLHLCGPLYAEHRGEIRTFSSSNGYHTIAWQLAWIKHSVIYRFWLFYYNQNLLAGPSPYPQHESHLLNWSRRCVGLIKSTGMSSLPVCLDCYSIDCTHLSAVRQRYFTVHTLKELFLKSQTRKIIAFIEDINFYHYIGL